MPEMPEVETIRQSFEGRAASARITDVTLHRAGLRFPFPEDFKATLTDAVITAVERRAKFLMVRLDNGYVWVTHLGMTGHFVIQNCDRESGSSGRPVKHVHFECSLSGPRGKFRLLYGDQRRFGYMLLVRSADLETADWYRELGVEPLSGEFTEVFLQQTIQGRKTDIKSLLTDQQVIAGIGNAYVCEALWRAEVRPGRPSNSLSLAEVGKVVNGVKSVLQEAVDVGIKSLDTAAETAGDDGYFDFPYKIYDRAGEPCPRQDGGRIEHVTSKGRSSYFCPACQN